MADTELLAHCFQAPPTVLRHILLSRGDDDFREVYLVEGNLYTGAHTRLAVKHTANTFIDCDRLIGIHALIDAYNTLGIYCPRMVPCFSATPRTAVTTTSTPRNTPDTKPSRR